MPQINKIVIVGGGSSGWMTAALLSHRLKFLDITLIESKKVSTIGVGESTLGHINRFMAALDLKDEDWMAECNATYKTSIKFTDFKEKGTYFHYPFGVYDTADTVVGPKDWFWYQAYGDKKYPDTDFAEMYVPSVLMTDQLKLCRNEDRKIPGFEFHQHTAYHMDAEKFGQMLKRKYAIPNGVKHIQDTVIDIKQNEQGEISEIITEDGLHLTADLFIDCTGFSKLLIEKVMGTKFISFGDTLFNDRALAARVPYIDPEAEMHSVTNCTAIENGWVWDIPLWTRRGTGYVHSSKFADWDQAEREFRNHLALRIGQEKAEETEMKRISIRHGIQDVPWTKNVCAIGLALGFIEPLESTGLLTTHENIMRLCDTLWRRDGYVNKIDVDGWCYAAREEIEGFRQFVSLHYALTKREDTEYWRYVTHNVDYMGETLRDLKPVTRTNVQGFVYNMNVNINVPEVIAGETFIFAGMGYNPFSKMRADVEVRDWAPGLKDSWAYTRQKHEEKKARIMEYVNTLPTHYQFLKDNIYRDQQ